MSAEQSRLRSAIQRIAKEDPELRGAIEASKSRGDQPGGVGVGESDGERDQICCDGSINPDNNPGTDERNPGDGGQDGLDPNDPADLDQGPGTLDGLTDCATGEPICFDGDGFIPPDGWDDPNDAPVAEGYIEGFFWSESGCDTTYRSLSPLSACLEYQFDCQAPSIDPDAWEFRLTKLSDNRYGCVRDGISDGLTQQYGIVTKQACPAPDGTCDDPIPVADAWPSDGCVNLAIIGGSIVGSKYDPENDGSYSAPRDEIELCDEDGNSILIRPSSDGGWKSIESLDGDIDPETGNGYLYAPDGKRIRQISPSEFRDDMV